MDFLKQLPTREKNKEGKIYLSPAQEAEEGCKKLLEDKFWIIGHQGKLANEEISKLANEEICKLANEKISK